MDIAHSLILLGLPVFGLLQLLKLESPEWAEIRFLKWVVNFVQDKVYLYFVNSWLMKIILEHKSLM